VRVIVDHDACESNGLCEGIAPEIFQLGPTGELQLLQEFPGDELRDKVQRAIRTCPKQALSAEGQGGSPKRLNSG
jgi:ferredoxin